MFPVYWLVWKQMSKGGKFLEKLRYVVGGCRLRDNLIESTEL